MFLIKEALHTELVLRGARLILIAQQRRLATQRFAIITISSVSLNVGVIVIASQERAATIMPFVHIRRQRQGASHLQKLTMATQSGAGL
jgi:hypothetical protein